MTFSGLPCDAHVGLFTSLASTPLSAVRLNGLLLYVKVSATALPGGSYVSAAVAVDLPPLQSVTWAGQQDMVGEVRR